MTQWELTFFITFHKMVVNACSCAKLYFPNEVADKRILTRETAQAVAAFRNAYSEFERFTAGVNMEELFVPATVQVLHARVFFLAGTKTASWPASIHRQAGELLVIFLTCGLPI